MRRIGFAALTAFALAATALAQGTTTPPERFRPCPTISKVEAGPFKMTATRSAQVSDCLSRARYAGPATLTVTSCDGNATRVDVNVVFETNTTASACGEGVIEGAVVMVAPLPKQGITGGLNGVVSAGGFTAVCNAEVRTRSTTKTPAPLMHLNAVVTAAPGPATANGKATLDVTIKGVLLQPSAAKR